MTVRQALEASEKPTLPGSNTEVKDVLEQWLPCQQLTRLDRDLALLDDISKAAGLAGSVATAVLGAGGKQCRRRN